MNIHDVIALLPDIILASMIVLLMLSIAFRRDHRAAAVLTLLGLLLTAASLPAAWTTAPRTVTPLLIIDTFSVYFTGLIVMTSFFIAGLSFSYFSTREGRHEEFYVLLLTATTGAVVLTASAHFASFFLGLEILSVSLYALAGYDRHHERSIEAGVKYLILAALSSAFILFGMALAYAGTGSMDFSRIASRAADPDTGLLLHAGIALIITGLGFKLAVVPFHLWTPDVYEGSPVPVTAFIATVSKGGVFALALRFFGGIAIRPQDDLFLIFTAVAVASMFAGNLLALLQTNVKRILAYSSISHMGYLMVALLVSGPQRLSAPAFYLAAYFVTTLGAFGVVAVLSGKEGDAEDLSRFTGLAARHPWLAGVLTAMLFSLAGIPLTAGFVAKFSIVAAGVGSALWMLVIALVINSVIGLFYYLRIIAAVYSERPASPAPERPLSRSGSAILTALTLILVWLGVYPAPVITLIEKMIQGLR
jgi:NADH-quinone oxidoreductase subunit N